jgi:hypothetical protein
LSTRPFLGYHRPMDTNKNRSKGTLFWAAFFSGLLPAATGYGMAQDLPYASRLKSRSDLKAMRGDWERVGADFDATFRAHDDPSTA